MKKQPGFKFGYFPVLKFYLEPIFNKNPQHLEHENYDQTRNVKYDTEQAWFFFSATQNEVAIGILADHGFTGHR
jgi:hypothetical protein